MSVLKVSPPPRPGLGETDIAIRLKSLERYRRRDVKPAIFEVEATDGAPMLEQQCSLDLPVSDRFDWWCHLAAQEVVPTFVHSAHRTDFYADVKMLRFGSANVTELEFDDMGSRRTPRLIRHSDPERWMLTLVSRGAMWVEQSRNRAEPSPGDLVLYDTSRPFQSQILDRGIPCRTVLLQVPRKALPLPEQILRPRVAQPIPSTSGAAALLRRFVEDALEHATTLTPDECNRLDAVVIGLLATLLATRADAEDLIPPQTMQQLLVQQAKAFVLGHLHDPRLSPALIAEALHVSVRHLHRLFRQEGLSVGEFIRRQRLERCRADLADPRLINRTVADVGARWGYHDAAVFNRAFKALYGIPPGEHRRQSGQLGSVQLGGPKGSATSPDTSRTAGGFETGAPRGGGRGHEAGDSCADGAAAAREPGT
jgi:AraC-like DNA-binding protein